MPQDARTQSVGGGRVVASGRQDPVLQPRISLRPPSQGLPENAGKVVTIRARCWIPLQLRGFRGGGFWGEGVLGRRFEVWVGVFGKGILKK